MEKFWVGVIIPEQVTHLSGTIGKWFCLKITKEGGEKYADLITDDELWMMN